MACKHFIECQQTYTRGVECNQLEPKECLYFIALEQGLK